MGLGRGGLTFRLRHGSHEKALFLVALAGVDMFVVGRHKQGGRDGARRLKAKGEGEVREAAREAWRQEVTGERGVGGGGG